IIATIFFLWFFHLVPHDILRKRFHGLFFPAEMLCKMDNVFAADKRSLPILFYEIPCWDSFLFWLDS
ncbi:hypothetical protein D3Z36_16725, partial [Lachnospiraceae bacterium]|nr:hypothetical protein [Lachnospiraceae bacterium]